MKLSNLLKKDELPGEIPLGSPTDILKAIAKNRSRLNMNDIVGSHDILFVCLDTLRYDVAMAEQEKGGTPNLNQYGPWIKCGAPGNFTYPSHHAMFAGFLPIPVEAKTILDRSMLFFSKNIGMGNMAPPKAFAFEGENIVEGLAKVGYETICIGGVAFFNKREGLGAVFPRMFKQSYWHPSFGCQVKESPNNQIDLAVRKLSAADPDQRVFMYINVDAIHYPNYFYLEGAKKDSVETHAAALRYVDALLPQLFGAFHKRGKTFVIVCSDHGSCYGEDGFEFHGVNHEIVNTVPYKHFILEQK